MGIFIDAVKIFEWIGVAAVVVFVIVLVAFIRSNYKVSRIDSNDVAVSDDWFYSPQSRAPENPMNFTEWFDEDDLYFLKEEEKNVH